MYPGRKEGVLRAELSLFLKSLEALLRRVASFTRQGEAICAGLSVHDRTVDNGLPGLLLSVLDRTVSSSLPDHC